MLAHPPARPGGRRRASNRQTGGPQKWRRQRTPCRTNKGWRARPVGRRLRPCGFPPDLGGKSHDLLRSRLRRGVCVARFRTRSPINRRRASAYAPPVTPPFPTAPDAQSRRGLKIAVRWPYPYTISRSSGRGVRGRSLSGTPIGSPRQSALGANMGLYRVLQPRGGHPRFARTVSGGRNFSRAANARNLITNNGHRAKPNARPTASISAEKGSAPANAAARSPKFVVPGAPLQNNV